MNTEKISVIIPVYNIEAYLPRCLHSVLNQSYQNLEILLVDDGSTDSSKELCDAYAKKDSRIRVIHQKNRGLSAARNSGLDVASGHFLFFLDGDDFIKKHTLAKLLKTASETGADCVLGQMQHVFIRPDGALGPKGAMPEKVFPETMDSKQMMIHMLLHGASACNNLIRRDIFVSTRFPLNLLNEDEITMLRIYELCKKTVHLNEVTYFYLQRPHSITHSNSSKRYIDFYCNTNMNLRYIRKKYPALQIYAESRLIAAMVYCYYMLWKTTKNIQEKTFFKRLRKNLRSKTFQKMAAQNPYVSKRDKLLMKAFLIL